MGEIYSDGAEPSDSDEEDRGPLFGKPNPIVEQDLRVASYYDVDGLRYHFLIVGDETGGVANAIEDLFTQHSRGGNVLVGDMAMGRGRSLGTSFYAFQIKPGRKVRPSDFIKWYDESEAPAVDMIRVGGLRVSNLLSKERTPRSKRQR